MSNFKTFLEYYKNNEIYLTESPLRIGRKYSIDLDNTWFNVEQAKEIIGPQSYLTIQKSLSDIDLHLYREKYDNTKFLDHWITAQPFIACYYIFETIGEGVQSLGVWNHREYKESARELLFNFYLNKYKFVISDNKHSDQGEDFWKKIIARAEKENYNIRILTIDNKEFSIDDVYAYWGNVSSFANYKIKIYAK